MTDIPEKYQQALSEILQQLESETGSLYQFRVEKFGQPKTSSVIGSFLRREEKIEVYSMNEEYKALEGIYENYSELQKRIASLANDDEIWSNLRIGINCYPNNLYTESSNPRFRVGHMEGKWRFV